jgi:IS5 family transposase
LTTKIHAIVDALGNPLAVSLTGEHVHDVTQAQVLTQEIEPAALLADKGYDSDGFVEHLEVRSIKPVIPPRANRKTPRLRLCALLRAQPRRMFLQHHQALSRHRNPLRKDR